MSMEGFFNNCLTATKEKYQKLLETPRGRGGNLDAEINEIIYNIGRAIKWGEISEETGKSLTAQFKQIDFSKLSEERAERKKQEKQLKKVS